MTHVSLFFHLSPHPPPLSLVPRFLPLYASPLSLLFFALSDMSQDSSEEEPEDEQEEDFTQVQFGSRYTPLHGVCSVDSPACFSSVSSLATNSRVCISPLPPIPYVVLKFWPSKVVHYKRNIVPFGMQTVFLLLQEQAEKRRACRPWVSNSLIIIIIWRPAVDSGSFMTSTVVVDAQPQK